MKPRIACMVSVLVIIAASILASSKLIGNFFYTSHDGEGHVIRMIEYDEAVHDGQLPVRMTKRINYGLGYPFFNFNYPAPYAIGQFFHEFGFSFVESFKLLMFVGTLLAGLGMLVFMKGHVGMLPAVISAVLYIFVPYHFLNMYVRGNPAENFALGLLPFLFYSVDRLVRTAGKKNILFILISSLFVLSHNTTVLLSIPLVAVYFLLSLPKKKKEIRVCVRQCIYSLLITAAMTSFFWLPVAVESRLTKLAELGEDYVKYFPTLKEVVYSPWGFGQYIQGMIPGKMSPQIGLVHEGIFVVVLLYAGISVCRKRKESYTLVWFFIGASVVSLFLMLPYSRFLWDSIFLLRYIQIPWRFLGVVAFATSFLAGVIIQRLAVPKILKWFGCMLLVAVVIYANRNHIRVNQSIVFTNPFEKNLIYGPSTTSKDEHMPRSAPRIYTAPDPNGTIIAGAGGVSTRTVWTTNRHAFAVFLPEAGAFRDNTSYFPGWTAKLDGTDVRILYDEDEYTRLRIVAPAGNHLIVFEFQEVWYRRIFDIVSLVTLASLGVWLVVKKGAGI